MKSSIADSGTAIVREAEVLKCEFATNINQAVLSLLQDQGAPIAGVVWFTIMDGYDWSMHMEPDRSRVFTWEKRK